MFSLQQRSYKKELLDAENIPFADIKQNMKELNNINTLLGGHKITIKGIKYFLRKNNQNALSVCEVGCGGGDNLKAIDQWAAKKNIKVNFTGIDIKEECIEFAKEQYPELNATWITRDYRKAVFATKPDIIFSSLFCHHFTEDELIKMFHWMKDNCTKGFFINDLNRIAYYSIKWITALFSISYLVKNDAPLSVARGFTKKEWQKIFSTAGIHNYSINWQWAFRHLIIYKNE